MVEETIKAIRETEAAADVIVKEAGEKSQKILEDARQEAERMIKSQEETHRISAQGISGRGPCADRERNQGVKGVCCPERSGGSECSDFSVSVVKRN